MICRVDFHVHTAASFDGRSTLEKITSAAQKRGLGAVAITEHDLCQTLPAAQNGVLLIPGCEISSQVGHITGLFLKEPLDLQTLLRNGRPSGKEACREIHRCGGVAVLAHPYQKLSADESRFPREIDGMEGVNARAAYKRKDANEKAAAYAAQHGLFCVGGSDAHAAGEVGNGYTEIECAELTLKALEEAVRNKRCRPVLARHSSHVEKGLSQFQKARRNGGLFRLGKAAAYVCYCAMKDMTEKR